MTEPIEATGNLTENFEKQLAVAVIFKNVTAGIATRGDMVDCTGKFYA
jgi:hypothetical protein